MGFEELDKPAALAGRGGLWFRLDDGLELHLGVDPDFRPARKAHAAFLIDDFDVALARLGAVAETDHRGRRRCHVVDPFGNRIELIAAA